MKIKSTNDKSIASQLTDILTNALPHVRQTGLTKDLRKISPDKRSKGKAINFSWRNSTFRLTENLRVQEYNFCNSLEDTELSKETMQTIVKSLNVTAEAIPEPQKEVLVKTVVETPITA